MSGSSELIVDHIFVKNGSMPANERSFMVRVLSYLVSRIDFMKLAGRKLKVHRLVGEDDHLYNKLTHRRSRGASGRNRGRSENVEKLAPAFEKYRITRLPAAVVKVRSSRSPGELISQGLMGVDNIVGFYDALASQMTGSVSAEPDDDPKQMLIEYYGNEPEDGDEDGFDDGIDPNVLRRAQEESQQRRMRMKEGDEKETRPPRGASSKPRPRADRPDNVTPPTSDVDPGILATARNRTSEVNSMDDVMEQAYWANVGADL